MARARSTTTGRFIRARRTSPAAGRRRFGIPYPLIEGTEESGVITGETVYLGAEPGETVEETKPARKAAAKSES
jgi:hypothetical protein